MAQEYTDNTNKDWREGAEDYITKSERWIIKAIKEREAPSIKYEPPKQSKEFDDLARLAA